MSTNEFQQAEIGLSSETRELYRVLRSLEKELDAVLAQNRDEENVHAAMLIDWIRSKDPAFAE